MKVWRILPLVALLGSVQVGAAQEPQPDIEVSRLPLDLNKVSRQLRQSAETRDRTGLRLSFRVDVYGAAPPIELFTKADNLASGPVPYGAPSHREMIDHVTPIEYRAPIMDFSALLRWLAERGKK